jgi:hypothetical protein
MRRREFVRSLAATVVAAKLLPAQQAASPQLPAPAPVPWTLGLNPATPIPKTAVAEDVAQAAARFFSARQMRTLTRLADLLLPPIGPKAGALQAETPAFLDFLIGDSPAARKLSYTAGLDWLDAEARKRYQQPFAALDNSQADALVKPWLRTWMNDHPPTEPHAGFLNLAHADIRRATVNSEAWSRAAAVPGLESTAEELYWSPVEQRLAVPLPPHVQAVPRRGHSIPLIER